MQPSSTSWCLRLRRADSSSLNAGGIRSGELARCIRMISWSKRLKTRYVAWFKMKSLGLPKMSSCLVEILAGNGRRDWEKDGRGEPLISGKECPIYLYYCHRIWRTLLQHANISQRNLMHKTSRIWDLALIRKEDTIVWAVHKKISLLNSATAGAVPLLIMLLVLLRAVVAATQKLRSITSRIPIIEDLYHKVTLPRLQYKDPTQGLDRRPSTQLKTSTTIRLHIKLMKRPWCRSWMLKRLPRESWFPLLSSWSVYNRSYKGF